MKSVTQGENVVLVHDEWCDIHDNKLVIARSIQCDGNSYVCFKHKICTVSYICYIWNQKGSYWIIWVSSDCAGDDNEKDPAHKEEWLWHLKNADCVPICWTYFGKMSVLHKWLIY